MEYIRATVCVIDIERARLTGGEVSAEVQAEIDGTFLWLNRADVALLIFG